MNLPHSPRGRYLCPALLFCSIAGHCLAEESVPRGTLTVDRDLVMTGAYSQLGWSINHPAPIDMIVKIDAAEAIQPLEKLQMRVRLLGVSFNKIRSNNGHGNNEDGVDVSNPGQGGGGPNGEVDLSGEIDDEIHGKLKNVEMPVELMWSRSNSAWERIFYGYQRNVKPSATLINLQVGPNDTFLFGVRGFMDAWLPFHHTGSGGHNCAILKNGDRLPKSASISSGSFLKPYIALDNTVKIGDRDLLVIWELHTTNPDSTLFDLQDTAILITFE